MPPSRALWLALLSLAVPGVGLSHSVSEELSLGDTQQGPQNPRSGSFTNTLSGLAELSDAFSLRLELGFTHDNGTKPKVGVTSGATSGGNILAFALGGDWTPNDNWTFGASADFSPRSISASQTTVQFEDTSTGRTNDADAVLRSASSSLGLTLAGGFLTSGDSALETAVDASAGVTRFDTTQSITSIQSARGPVTAQQVEASCGRTTTRAAKATCASLLAAIQARPASLGQFHFSLALTETISTDTDVALTGTAYVYDQDPTQVGYFSVLAVGRTVSTGAGIPIAPLQYTVRPMLAHRFGSFWLDGSYQYGVYVADLGVSHSLSVRAQYRFDKQWRAWVRVGGQVDLDADGNSTAAGSVSAGVRASF